MNFNICNNCGGEYEYRNGRWICRSCGAYKPEEISGEEVTLLYTAFQKLRLAEFDEAEAEFDDIIRKYPENPDAYWGRLMAKYGIKYEEDFDGRIIPTCYAASIENVMESSDYRKALQYADEESRAYYRQQAEYIERVRREWIEKANKEKPYDIFLCYKESDLASGIERTRDSVDVQDLYIHLTNKGYRVFYSHESLRDKVGEKYEPYIFNALSSAQVMLVYGSKPEYITSTWLKNEWTRYEKRLKNGEKKPGSLLVACDGFSPSELPRALSSMQCFNASERSFYSDLDEAIERILHKEEDPPVYIPPVPPTKPPATPAAPEPPAPKSKTPLITAVVLIAAAVLGALIWGISASMKCDHVIVTNPSVEPTCTENGWTEEQYCSVCGEVFQMAEPIPRREHKASGEASCEEASVCILCDEELAPALGHRPGDAATCTEAELCQVCGKELNPALGHDPGAEATCQEAQYCKACHEELAPAKGHSYSEEVTEPTCLERGYTTYSCECGDTYRDNYVDALDHLRSSEATCTEDSLCERCGALLASKNGHVPGTEATCESPQYCLSCNTVLAPQKEHEYETAVTPPTCTEVGYTVYTCRCGDTYNENFVDALGHSSNGKTSCAQEDLCTRCGKVLSEATAHTVTEWIVDRELSESVSGIRHGSCDVCRERIEMQYQYSQDLHYEELDDGTYAVHYYQCKDKLVIIPAAHEGMIVSAIADYGFSYRSEIQRVILPDTVSVIGEGAFSECENLESIKIGGSVTKIGDEAFYNCKSLLGVDLSGTSVTSIGESAFANCHAMTSASMSGSLQTVGAYAFERCAALTAISLPETLTQIGISAFANCDALREVVLPNSLILLGESAFSECDHLKTVTVGDSLAAIPIAAFFICPNLTTVDLGSGITEIGETAFYQCEKLVACPLPESLTKIGRQAFYGCKSLKGITIPDQVATMGEEAFYDCDSLQSLVIGNGLEGIPNNAFGDCDSLFSVVIGDGVTFIGVSAFLDCNDLTSVTLGKNLSQILDQAFYQCNRLVEVVNHSSLNIQAGSESHGYVGYYAKDIHTGESKIQNENGYLFWRYGEDTFLVGYAGEETALTLPDSHQGNAYAIYDGSFVYKSSLTSMVIPNGVTGIGAYVGYECDSLTGVTVGSGVTEIDANAFYGCTYLDTVIFTGTVEQWNGIAIGAYAFEDTLVTKIVCSDGEVALR